MGWRAQSVSFGVDRPFLYQRKGMSSDRPSFIMSQKDMLVIIQTKFAFANIKRLANAKGFKEKRRRKKEKGI